MPSKQLVDLVDRLKKSGIQISFTKPRSTFLFYLQEKKEVQRESDFMVQQKNYIKGKKKHKMLKFI